MLNYLLLKKVSQICQCFSEFYKGRRTYASLICQTSFVITSKMQQQERQAMFIKVLAVFFALLHATQGGKTTCEASTVYEGSPANITCIFSEDVRLSKKNVKVLKTFPGHTQFDPDTSESVVECFWSDSQTFKCDVKDGYQLQDNQVTNKAVVVISSVTKRFEGTYMCEAVPSDPTDVQVCELHIAVRTDGRSMQLELYELRKHFDDQRSMGTAIIAITALTLIALFVVTVLFFCRGRLPKCLQQAKKRRDKTAEEGVPLQTTNTAEQHSKYPDDICVTIERTVLSSLIKIANADMAQELITNLKCISDNLKSTSPYTIADALIIAETKTTNELSAKPQHNIPSSDDDNGGMRTSQSHKRK